MCMDLNTITERIIGAAIEVHRHLSAGLLESAYEACLCRELDLLGIQYKKQVELPVVYKGIKLDCGYRIDLLVEQAVVVEIKSVKSIEPVHEAQLITYLKLGGWKIGLILNFNVKFLKDGIKRKVLNLDETTSAHSAALR
jgi:GxxExxY protein